MLYCALTASPPPSPGCCTAFAPPAKAELLLLLKNTPGPACSSMARPGREIRSPRLARQLRLKASLCLGLYFTISAFTKAETENRQLTETASSLYWATQLKTTSTLVKIPNLPLLPIHAHFLERNILPSTPYLVQNLFQTEAFWDSAVIQRACAHSLTPAHKQKRRALSARAHARSLARSHPVNILDSDWLSEITSIVNIQSKVNALVWPAKRARCMMGHKIEDFQI